MVGGNPIVVLRVLLELVQASPAQAGGGTVESARDLVGEVGESHGLFTDERRCGDWDLREDWFRLGTIVR
jgi:hypothetical protein